MKPCTDKTCKRQKVHNVTRLCPKPPLKDQSCGNCGKAWTEDDLSEISDFWGRVSPGERMPSGECPDCGCLCHPSDPKDLKVRAALRDVKMAHDVLSTAIEDPEGGNDAEHDAAVHLLSDLLVYYAALDA